MPIAAGSQDGTGSANVPVVIVPPPATPVEPPQLPPAPPPPAMPTVQPATTTIDSSPSGSGDEGARGLPQANVGPIGPIVEPHPQEPPTNGGTQPTETPTETDTIDTGTDGLGTAYVDLSDPTFAGWEYAPFFGEGGGLAFDANSPKILRGDAFVASVRKHSADYDLDPLAVIANAMAEGLGGGIGDSGHAFGPWQIWAEDGRLPQFSGQPLYSPLVQAWAWTDNGIDYALRSMRAGGASGLTGHAAVSKIVYGFEMPADKPGAVRIRNANYDQLRGWGNSVWSHVAGMANGPSLSATSPTEGRPPAAQPQTPVVQVNESWRGLMKTLGSDMRFAADHATKAANEIARMIRQ